MKIFPISDTHLDMAKDHGISFVESLVPDPDTTLVIAGDMCEHYLIDYLIREFCARWKDVVYVSGNHEYWHCSLEDIDELLTKLDNEIPNLHVLQDKVVEIEGQRFIGGTLWFEWTPLHVIHGLGWSDFVQIHNDDRDIFQRHNRTRWFIEQHLQAGDVVVTHHLPSYLSIEPPYQGSILNIFYANRMDLLIEDVKPALWIHGHVHGNNDYMIEDTRIISNPFGYLGANHGFREDLIIEL